MLRPLRCVIAAAAVACFASPSFAAASSDVAGGTALLFSGTQSKLTQAEKETIFNELGFQVSAGGLTLEDPECGPVYMNTQIVDLDDKGSQDVVVLGGNLCTSGGTGASVWLFVKDKTGHYRKNLGFPAASANVMKDTRNGYHDLSFGGPGKCYPVWKWNGKAYQFNKSINDAGQACSAH